MDKLTIIGIDPGFSGAIAVINTKIPMNQQEYVVSLENTPLLKKAKGCRSSTKLNLK